MKNNVKYLFLSFVILFLIGFLFVATPSVFAATLSLSPSSVGYAAGDFFDVNVVLDTQNTSIDGVDVRYLNYNPSLLEVQDSNSSVTGVQITAGSLMPMSNINNVDSAVGKIQFSQSSIGGSSYNGTGNLATIRFKALSVGTASVNFDYTSGNTTDTNIASNGVDVLSAVTNGSYVISAASSGGGGSTGGSSSGGSIGGSSGGGTSGGGGASSGGGGNYYVSSYNNAPNLPSSVRQFVNSGLITLSEGDQTVDTTIYFKAVISDPDNNQVKLRAEIRPIADGFTGISDGGVLETAFMPSMSTASIIRGGLSKGAYKWRYQVIDSNGGATAWQEFGTFGNTDFTIDSQTIMQPAAQATNNTNTGSFSYNFTRNLKYGLKGDSDVKQLQKVLSVEGVFSNDESVMTGNFFNMTKAAVVKFQQKYNISPASGFVGPLTREKLNSLYGGASSSATIAAATSTQSSLNFFTRSLYLGIRGDDVMKLQDILTREGVYNGYIGGYYGPLTEEAVLKFQNKYGISGANGIFGPKTRAKLMELYSSL